MLCFFGGLLHLKSLESLVGNVTAKIVSPQRQATAWGPRLFFLCSNKSVFPTVGYWCIRMTSLLSEKPEADPLFLLFKNHEMIKETDGRADKLQV